MDYLGWAKFGFGLGRAKFDFVSFRLHLGLAWHGLSWDNWLGLSWYGMGFTLGGLGLELATLATA